MEAYAKLQRHVTVQVMIQNSEKPHRRFNPLTGEWVLVSPHRTQRPWQGQQEDIDSEQRSRYERSCYLCPGNTRANGKPNEHYGGVFVFENDFAALLPILEECRSEHDVLMRAEGERGYCRVICFSPRHDLSVANMTLKDITDVVSVWKEETGNAHADPSIAYAQIFENRGAAMGCSNPHPHCQIWASSSVPSVVAVEHGAQNLYTAQHNSILLLDYVTLELDRRVRLVYENDHFAILVPYWAVWPFETLVVPKRHHPTLQSLSNEEVIGLADIYRTLVRLYDQLFDTEFPYTMGIHQAPLDRHTDGYPEWQLHLHFYPPLLRSATVKKFMVGYEMLASPQRDITAEAAAHALREAVIKVGEANDDDSQRWTQ